MCELPSDWGFGECDGADATASLCVLPNVFGLLGRELMEGPLQFRRPFARRPAFRRRPTVSSVNVVRLAETRTGLESARVIQLRFH